MKRISLIVALPVIFSSAYSETESTYQLAAAFDQIQLAQSKVTESDISALISRIGQVIYRKALGEIQ